MALLRVLAIMIFWVVVPLGAGCYFYRKSDVLFGSEQERKKRGCGGYPHCDEIFKSGLK